MGLIKRLFIKIGVAYRETIRVIQYSGTVNILMPWGRKGKKHWPEQGRKKFDKEVNLFRKLI